MVDTSIEWSRGMSTPLEFLASNIVNQLPDMYTERIPSDKWIEVRQATNDMADEFVLGILENVREQGWNDALDAAYLNN